MSIGAVPVGARPAGVAAPSRREHSRTVTVVLAFTAVVAVSLLGAIVYGLIPLHRGGEKAGATVTASASAPAVTASAPGGPAPVVDDPLTAEGDWVVVQDPANQASCDFDDALVVEKASSGPYRCPGPRRPFTDFSVAVTTRLLTKGGCAGVWLRFDKVGADAGREAGYVLAVCADGYRLMTHGVDGVSDMADVASFPFAEPVPLREPVGVGITAEGSRLTFTRDGRPVGTWKDTRFKRGRIVLGALNTSSGQTPLRVSFTDIVIRA